jgi:hypothetical protein
MPIASVAPPPPPGCSDIPSPPDDDDDDDDDGDPARAVIVAVVTSESIARNIGNTWKAFTIAMTKAIAISTIWMARAVADDDSGSHRR